jgi:hypothetical protein
VELLNEIIKLINENGVLTVTVAVVLFIILKKVKLDFVSDLFKKITNKTTKKQAQNQVSKKVSLSESDIINHEIFNYVDYWVYSVMPTLILKSDFRTYVFRDYLQEQFRAYKKVLTDFAIDGSYKDMDWSELRKTMLRCISDIVFEYESKMRAEGIPEIIIIKMKAKNNDTISLMNDLINTINEERYSSPNNLLPVYTFLNFMNAILENMMQHCENVSNELNGELSGLTYKGYKEPKSKGH